ncbi:TWiK family of potassium channels protein 18-like isoform X2 [Cephus cinctus]|uniref:TWiK family of potassium channels protein 18-like isoform X2 n=1 Tax=Cephus cinctus TaxID=211228 RepID=A0AAJ7C294_CEPCN|nr:TWiK family of potassium channels protein 18-like isoform X2 [Cephus cinctus]
MQSRNPGSYYQRRCCPARGPDGPPSSARGAELLCCCCSCNTTTSSAPGLLASIGVCVLVLGYTLLGAFAFMALEGGLKSEPPTVVGGSSKVPREPGSRLSNEDESAAMELRARTVEKLWIITEDLNVLYKENWTRLAAREVLEFQESLVRGLSQTPPSIYKSLPPQPPPPSPPRHRGVGFDQERRNHARRWTFSSSLLYSLTLITTIGYGSVAPRTVWGRLITIVYALAGIPLMLVYLSTVGDVLARSFRRLYARLCRPRSCTRKSSGIGGKAYRYDNHVESKAIAGSFYPNCGSEGLQAATSSTALQDSGSGKRHFHPCSLSLSPSPCPDAVRIPISLCLAIIIVYICGGAVMFNRLEGWSLLEGSYFCFTSLGTIGFGDLVPGGRNAPSATLEELSLCACSLYILAGMGLIAMCFNLVQEEVVRVVKVFGRLCGVGMGSAGMSGMGNGPGGKVDAEGDGGSNDSRLSEEEAIAMSVVSAS